MLCYVMYQWEFQEPKLEVPTIYKAYVRDMPQNMALYCSVPSFQDPGFPLDVLLSYVKSCYVVMLCYVTVLNVIMYGVYVCVHPCSMLMGIESNEIWRKLMTIAANWKLGTGIIGKELFPS